MIDLGSIVTVTADQVACDMKGELLLLQTGSGVYYGLNPAGTRVWNLMLEPKQVAGIRDVLLAEYQIDRETCTRDLLDLLEKLASKQLIEVKSAAVA
jgi:hypothetical protein